MSLPSIKWMTSHPAYFLAFGFGSGLMPKAPGTWGSLAAIPFCVLLNTLPLSSQLLCILLACIFGVGLCGKTATALKTHDHPGIVWDEFAGMMIATLFIELHILPIVLSFLLFRLFDIWKPWPIRLFDAKLHGGIGIMLDDLLAGMYALITMFILVKLQWLDAIGPLWRPAYSG